MIPFVKARLGLDERTLGLILLAFGGGSMVAMPLAGLAIHVWGSRRVVAIASLAGCAALPLLAARLDTAQLAITLFVFGAALGALDVAMNAQALAVQHAAGRPIMSGFHALFSVGGLAGAAVVSVLLRTGLGLGQSALGIALVLGAVALWQRPHFIADHGTSETSSFTIVPKPAVLILGALCFMCFLGEGAVLDWSAVFLTTERAVDTAYAGLGYAAFALTMTVGRLMGDSVVHRLGAKRVIIYGGSIAAAGFLMATVAPMWQAALLGYALVGAGCSNIVPVLYTAVGKQTLMPEAIAVPAITTIGYAGILAGPALIGFVAHGSSLGIAFGLIALSLVAVAASGKVLKV